LAGSVAHGSSSDGAYRAENHCAGERAQGGIAGAFLRGDAQRHESQSGDTYDSNTLHHFLHRFGDDTVTVLLPY
jgi:hypothetical protein